MAIYPIRIAMSIIAKNIVTPEAVFLLYFAINLKSQPNARETAIAIMAILLKADKKQKDSVPVIYKTQYPFLV